MTDPSSDAPTSRVPPPDSPPDGERTVVVMKTHDGPGLPVGYALQEYVIDSLIGEGGFGIVYLASDTRLGRHVALKEYMPSNLASRSADLNVSVRSERHRETFELGLRSFVNEAKLLASFDHPSLVKVYRFWEENGTAYMVMPFYQGPTLKKWLTELGKKPDEAWLLALLWPMIEALEQLHNAQPCCLHRDIAPDNILLLPQQITQAGPAVTTVRPLLLDFGAARRVIGDMTQSLTVILKPGYAPFEQYAEAAAMKQGPWTDVYALSAVLYACITGRAPVPSVSRIMTDEMVPAVQAGAGRYSPAFLQAIDTGLAVRPNARPQSMAALRDLFAAAAQRPAGPQTISAPAWPKTHAVPPPPSTPSPTTRIEPVMTAAPDLEKTLLAPSRPRGERRPVSPTAVTPAPAAGTMRWALPLLAFVLFAGGGWWWWWSGHRSGGGTLQVEAPLPAKQSAADAAAPAASAPAATPPAAPTAAPTAAIPEPTPFSVQAALQDIVNRGDARLSVTALPNKTALTIGKDLLKFRVRSSEPGYVYVFFAGTERNKLNLLFPNQLDKNNRIEGDRELVLPRKRWEVQAGGPPGTNQLVALVSRRERDLGNVGLSNTSDPIPEFDLALARQLWAQRPSGPGGTSPFVGKAVCDAVPCDESYGATLFEITEVSAPSSRQATSTGTARPRESAALPLPPPAAPTEPALDPKRLECEVLVRAGQRALSNRSYDDAMQRAEEAQSVYNGCVGAADLARNARQAKDRARNAAVIQ